ncbi:hypothetical protein SCHPADRAFT_432801 [Schizopora paradoxa]|uniref:Uncharacterized protein n=1 Tax=Schizopora paradoxa TaxID=27342 RepID=A0A0H2RRZ4_9AGAM|nr:hypothetical protein SCHPADRAFT_432801 [Schizopora paradoxa]
MERREGRRRFSIDDKHRHRANALIFQGISDVCAFFALLATLDLHTRFRNLLCDKVKAESMIIEMIRMIRSSTL